MNWANLSDVEKLIKLPAGYKLEQLGAERVTELTQLIVQWYPDISVGSESCHLDPEYYKNETTLLGTEPHRDLFPIIFTKDGEIRAFCTIKKDDGGLAMTGRLGAVSPESRHGGVGRAGIETSIAFAKLMGFGVVYHFATLTHAFSQKSLESLGFKVVGIVPAFDRDMIAPGVVKRVPEAVYAKVLAAESEIYKPRALDLQPETKALWEMLFGKLDA